MPGDAIVLPQPKFTGPKSGIAVGLNAGHIVQRRTPKARPSNRKGYSSDRLKLIRKVVREVVGFSPYEKRAMELVKGGGSNGNKRAMRLVKRRLGSMKRAKKKMAELQGFIEAGM